MFQTEILKTVYFTEQRDSKKLCQEAASSWEKPSHFTFHPSLFSMKNGGWAAEVVENCDNIFERIFNLIS